MYGILIVAVIAIVAGLLLSWASIQFAVPVDEKQAAVREALPGANCGACGFSGCDGYAAALAAGTAEIGLCSPGGPDVAEECATILGKAAGEMVRKVALVQALRESFPHNVSGMYTAEEVGQVEPVELPVEVPHDVRPGMQDPQESQEVKSNSNPVENNSKNNSNISDPQPAPAENPQTEPQQMNAAEAALFGSFK